MNAHFRLTSLVCVALLGCPSAPAPDPLPAPPQVVRFTASPTSVSRGERVTLSWETSNATSVEVVDLNRGAIAAADALSGQVQVPVSQTTVFVVSARNGRGVRVSAVASVNVEGVDSSGIVFTAYPAVLPASESGLLVWNAPGAQRVEIAPMGGTTLDLRGQISTGSVSVNPTEVSTTYVMRADGQTHTIVVQRAQGISEFATSTPNVRAGEMATLSWKTSHATKVRLTSPGRGVLTEKTLAAEVAQGTFTDTLGAQELGSTVTYVLEVDGAAPTLSRALTLAYGNAPTITTLTTDRFAKTGTTFPVQWVTTGADRIEIVANGTVLYRSPTPAIAATATVRLPAPTAGVSTVHTFRAISTGSGAAATRTFAVFGVTDVGAPTLVANPTSTTAGTAVTLTFTAPGAARTRILENGEVTVAAIEGQDAGAGTVTVFPNRATTTYELIASNTLEPAVRASATVAVSQTIGIAADDGGIVFEAQGVARVKWAAPGQPPLVGFALPQPQVSSDASAFIDISTTGERVVFANSDEAVTRIVPPDFEAFVYGRRFDTPVWVSTNGFFQFSSLPVTNARPAPVALPALTLPEGFVAPLWGNLELGTGAVFWQLRGVAPERELIIQWNAVRLRGSSAPVTFQARVHQLGTIVFAYKTAIPTVATPPVIGFQGNRNAGPAVTLAMATQDAAITFAPSLTSPTLVSTLGGTGGFLRLPTGVMRVLFDTIIKPSDLFISEVMSRPNPAVTAGQWFEVTNRSGATIDMSGWSLMTSIDGGTQTLPNGTVLSPRNYLVVGASANPLENDNLPSSTAVVTGLQVTNELTLDNRNGFSNTFSTSKVPSIGESLNADPGPFVLKARPDAGTPGLAPDVCGPRASQTYGTLSPNQRGTPGAESAGACMGYTMSTITPRFRDISTSGTPVTLLPTSIFFPAGDEGLGAIDLSAAPVQLFGRPVTTLTVSSNGWLVPRGGYTGDAAFDPKVAPDDTEPSDGVIAPFWDDLEFLSSRPGAGLRAQRFAMGADPNEPRPHWIVQWNRIDFFAPRADMSFQVKLFVDGDVEFHYGAMTGTGAAGDTATIWMEADDGSRALTSSIATPTVAPNSAVRFTRVP